MNIMPRATITITVRTAESDPNFTGLSIPASVSSRIETLHQAERILRIPGLMLLPVMIRISKTAFPE
jgi:hypothetical protein